MRHLSAVGYESVEGSLFAAPKILATNIVLQYQICSLTPQLAKSDFFTDEDLFCGARVIYGVEQDLNIFGMETDNNEYPETMSGPGVTPDSLTICQSQKFEWKISNADKRIMCSNFSRWEANLRRQISKNITKMIDAYSIPKIIASAAFYNTGNNAGKETRRINLGAQDSTALVIDSSDAFEDAVLSMREVALETGMMCGTGEIPGEGESAIPALVIPLGLERYALKLLKELNQCCSDRNSMVTGLIGELYGFKVITSRWLIPGNFGAAGILAPMMMVDPNQVLHAFDVITNKWWEGKWEDYLVGEFVWDTHVMNPDGVIVAIARVGNT